MSRKFKANRCAAVLDYDWTAVRHNRISIVNLLLAETPNGDYLEIGCAGNELFDAVMASRKVGVDPVRGGTHRMTSDAFFAAHPEARFDVVFIDGLHLYDQVRRDLVNALGALKPGGWIALHDMLPRDWLEEHVPQIRTSGWTGDGWKIAFELLEAKGVDFRLIAIDHGVAVVKALGDHVRVPDLGSTLRNARFSYLHRHFARLPVVGYDVARAWIESRRVTRLGDESPSPL